MKVIVCGRRRPRPYRRARRYRRLCRWHIQRQYRRTRRGTAGEIASTSAHSPARSVSGHSEESVDNPVRVGKRQPNRRRAPSRSSARAAGLRQHQPAGERGADEDHTSGWKPDVAARPRRRRHRRRCCCQGPASNTMRASGCVRPGNRRRLYPPGASDRYLRVPRLNAPDIGSRRDESLGKAVVVAGSRDSTRQLNNAGALKFKDFSH